GQLRDLLARLNLDDKSPQVRYDAVQRIIKEGVNDNSVKLLRERKIKENTLLVNNAISNGLYLYQLQSDEVAIRIDAIQNLRGSLESQTRNELRRLQNFDENPEVQAAAAEALDSISSKIEFYKLIENIFFGLSL